MLRILLILLVAWGGLFAAADTLHAQDDDPTATATSASKARIEAAKKAETYFALSWIKILSYWLLFLAWVYTTDWVNRDGLEMKLNYMRWNPIVVGTFMAAFLLLLIIPVYWLGITLLSLAYVAPLTAYVIYRNINVEPSDRVLTRSHIRYWMSVHLGKVGVNIAAEARDPREAGPPVKLSGRGGANDVENNARTLAARQAPGLLLARQILADGLELRCSAIMLNYSQESAAVSYMIDGVWLNREPIEREAGDPALEALKILCALSPQDRQSTQKGAFGAEYEGRYYTGTLACQGTKTGERALVQLEQKKIAFDTLDQLGMRDKLQEQVHEALGREKGILLLSAMPASGLRTTADVLIRHTDRFTREFMAIEEEAHRYEDIENCPVMTYSAAKGETPMAVLRKVFRHDPQVVIIRDLVDGESIGMICDEVASENRLIISTIRAKDSAEALLRVLALGVEAGALAEVMAVVVGQRLVRKLCTECKEAYAPTPQILQQLGIPQGRIEAFYRPPQEPEEVCEHCNGIGYYGRTAVFEYLPVGDAVREALNSGPKLETLRQAARKDGMRSLQEEGILLVAKGITSLPELMRVLRQ